MSDAQDTSDRAEKRRAILASLHLHDSVAGRLSDGMGSSDRVLVAAFKNPAAARQFRNELTQLGVKAWIRPEGMKSCVEVAYRDRHIAFERLPEFTARVPDKAPTVWRKPYDFAILGAALGAAAGIISLRLRFPLWIFSWVGFVFNGAFLGYVLDPARRLRRNGVPGQYSVVDLFLLTSAVAILFASIKYLLEVMRLL